MPIATLLITVIIAIFCFLEKFISSYHCIERSACTDNYKVIADILQYNPLRGIYSSTNPEHISFNTDFRKLSGIALMQLYFKREQLISVLDATTYQRLMKSAETFYHTYSKLVDALPNIIYIPDMYGYGKPYGPTDDNDIKHINEIIYILPCVDNHQIAHTPRMIELLSVHGDIPTSEYLPQSLNALIRYIDA